MLVCRRTEDSFRFEQSLLHSISIPLLIKRRFSLGKMNKTMGEIGNGAFLLNAISHNERQTLFSMFVSSRMESVLNRYKTRAVFALKDSYFKVFLI
jgi:hypothetical protein